MTATSVPAAIVTIINLPWFQWPARDIFNRAGLANYSLSIGMSQERDYHDIPGTTVFDGVQCRRGYHLNQFCMSLMSPENRARFQADEASYLDEWQLTHEQKAAVRARDYNTMIALGGNIYFLAKIGATDGHSFVQLTSSMSGMVASDYVSMMVAGGRSWAGLTSKRENAARGRK
jgi:protocatechuate 4,5-dioxygenase, alpha chain